MLEVATSRPVRRVDSAEPQHDRAARAPALSPWVPPPQPASGGADYQGCDGSDDEAASAKASSGTDHALLAPLARVCGASRRNLSDLSSRPAESRKAGN
jgi:hypothetical protein